MKFWHDFKSFCARGNLIDLAVGIIIGAAFNKIVQSLVKDILTPVIGIFMGEVSVSDWAWNYDLPLTDKVVEIKYGSFLQASLDFVIMAFVVFLIVKAIKTIKDKAEDPDDETVPTPKDIALLSEIRDSLKVLADQKVKQD